MNNHVARQEERNVQIEVVSRARKRPEEPAAALLGNIRR